MFVGHEEQTYGVAFSRDGRRAYSAGEDGTARVWDVATGEERRRFRYPRFIICVAPTPDDQPGKGDGPEKGPEKGTRLE